MSKRDTAADVNLGWEVLSGTTARIILTIFGFVGTVVFSRSLGPTGFGGYTLLLAIVTIAIRPVDGYSEAAKKRFSEDVDEVTRGKILSSQFVLIVASTIVAYVAVSLLDTHLVSYTEVDNAPKFFIILFLTTGVFTLLIDVADARGKVGVTNWLNTLKKILLVIFQLLLVLSGFGISGMVLGDALGSIAVFPFLLYVIGVKPRWPSWNIFQNLWSYAKYSIPNSFLVNVYSKLDIFILGAILSPDAAAYYEVAYRMASPASLMSYVIGAALMARVSTIRSHGKNETNDVRNALAFSSLIAFPMFFGALALSNKIVVTVYGSEYQQAGMLLLGLSVYQIIQSQTVTLLAAVRGLDRPDMITGISTVALGLNIILGIALTQHIGPIGVVIATILAEALRYVGLVVFVSRSIPFSTLFPKQIGEQFVSALIMFASIMLVLQLISVQSWISLGAIIGFGATVYFGTLVGISASFRLTARSSLPKIGL
ncbi:oligosaccharide flippase family protein [Natrialbaceae archaeon GCM10025810]|uniref:oligosaccharide flippase family protein n=1 Tax=Halovalidus salilacus TaxID=3075124 RepID=UPI0036075211